MKWKNFARRIQWYYLYISHPYELLYINEQSSYIKDQHMLIFFDGESRTNGGVAFQIEPLLRLKDTAKASQLSYLKADGCRCKQNPYTCWNDWNPLHVKRTKQLNLSVREPPKKPTPGLPAEILPQIQSRQRMRLLRKISQIQDWCGLVNAVCLIVEPVTSNVSTIYQRKNKNEIKRS